MNSRTVVYESLLLVHGPLKHRPDKFLKRLSSEAMPLALFGGTPNAAFNMLYIPHDVWTDLRLPAQNQKSSHLLVPT